MVEDKRIERDSLGEVAVPAEAYWGASTARARENFPVSGIPLPPSFIAATALVKEAAARVNGELGLLPGGLAEAVARAAGEAGRGELGDQFDLDVFQTGSGTSTNMNVNEVVAARANELLTGRRGGREPVHPNDHVNLGQSSNDVMPTALHIAAARQVAEELLPAMQGLQQALAEKAERFAHLPKIGRTHLQDAVPIRLGDEFGGWARQVEAGRERVAQAAAGLRELALGGTAVGNGVNTHPEFAGRVIERLNRATGLGFRRAANGFEAQACRDGAVFLAGALKTCAGGLMKIAGDLRLLASGPRCGIGEIELPSLQPGSSIMPGKVNPVIPEAVVQAAAQIAGNEAAVALGGQMGHFELNAMIPLIAHNLLQSIGLAASASRILAEKCVAGIEAREERCRGNLARSLALATYLVPAIGYDRAAEVSKQAYARGTTVKEEVVAAGLMGAEEFDRLLARAGVGGL
jgi:fumarate hydratase class II